MIRIQQLKLPFTHSKEDLLRKLAKTLDLSPEHIRDYKLVRRSIDARKKQDISYVYTIDVSLSEKANERLPKRIYSNNVKSVHEAGYQYPAFGTETLSSRPVIVGSGPAGLFCAYALAEGGYCPIVIERGRKIEERIVDVERFWDTGILDPNSNVQFGEGGAGTFSDGKLNTQIKDSKGRKQKVLDTLVAFGAPEDIAYESKPHVGTDRLTGVVRNMRNRIIELGGSFLFETRAVDFIFEQERIVAVVCKQGAGERIILSEALVLAIGHSARDTFELLESRGFPMEAKSFAVGLRVEHPQEMINKNQYGEAHSLLPAAPYKLAGKGHSRGVYSFCMCPGGYVVNASSEHQGLCVNGMSDRSRSGKNANSAIILAVTPQDFLHQGPLSGISFQRKLEEKAYQLAKGAIPQQLFGDFEREKESREYGDFASSTKGSASFAPLHELLTKEMTASFCEGMHLFGKQIPGFDRYDGILSGVESRTSSPLRILRDEGLQSKYRGIYPCGEGAGYAGGILSAAVDGLKVAEEIRKRYRKSP